MPTIFEAKEYLRLWRTLPTAHYGALFQLDDSAQEAPLSEFAKEAHADVVRIDERTYRAPSAWHAAAWMLDQAMLVAHGATHDKQRDLTAAYQSKFGAPVFRGQRNPEWKLVATLFRSASAPPHVVLALELFINAMMEVMTYEENTMNGRFVHMAAAQHYGEKTASHDGMLTPLLDFSADPRVATFFACLNADPAHDREVVVYGMPLSVLGMSGGRIMLPPPWLKRLWAQRGLFLDCTKIPPEFDLRELCFRVLFPPAPEFAQTMLEQSDGTISPPDPWFEKAIAWAIASAKSLTAMPPNSLGNWLIQDCGEPPFRWYALFPFEMQQNLPQLVDMFEWLAIKVDKQKLVYDLNTFDLILKDNNPLFRSLHVVFELLRKLPLNVQDSQHRLLSVLNAVNQAFEQAGAGKTHESTSR